MYSPDDLAAGLPARRDDEPAELRRDIVDELADHLDCATRREQISGRVNETEARRRAIDRFGDPVRIARKLWFDAMWEKIMSQRMLVAACSAMVLICCAALAVTWKWLDRQERMLEVWQRASETQMRENRALMEQFVSASAQNRPPSEWNPVEFRLVTGREDGPPAVGVSVVLSIAKNDFGVPTYRAESDEQGRVRFEKVRYGDYALAMQLRDQIFGQVEISFLPDEPVNKTIVVPTGDPPKNVELRAEWPEDIAARSPQIVFYRNSLQLQLPHPGFRDPIGWDRSPRRADKWIWVDTTGNFYERESRFHYGDLKTDFKADEHASIVTLQSGFRPLAQFEWPGREYVATDLWIVFPLNEVIPKPVESERVAAVWLESSDWNYDFRLGNGSGLLVLKPTDGAVEQIRASLKTIEAFQAQSTDGMPSPPAN